MTFEEYLISKKIDSAAFRKAEADQWQQWSDLFNQVSPASFTSQKLYLINPIRRKYKLVEAPKEAPAVASAPASESTPAAKPKPVFKPKIK